MANKITHGKDPNEGTRRRTTKGKGKWESAFANIATKKGSTQSWNRSTNSAPRTWVKKNINK